MFKSPIECALWPWSLSDHIIGATKDDASVQKEDAGPPPPWEEFLNRGPAPPGPVNGISTGPVRGAV